MSGSPAPDVDRALLVRFLDEMVSVPSPNGRERDLARHLAELGTAIEPNLSWEVDEFDGERANLLVSSGDGGLADVDVLLLAHLDTSLDGPGEHRKLGLLDTSEAWEPDLRLVDGRVVGAGVAVAKGPAAGALSALVAASRCTALPPGVAVLLTSGGTHRLTEGGGFAAGLRRALEHGLSPRVAVNVKAGSPTVMWEEPGSAYVRLDASCSGGPAMLRGPEGDGGAAMLLASVGPVVETWRRHLRDRPAHGTSGWEVGLGAIECGLPTKPDLLAARGSADLYLVHPPECDAGELVAELDELLHERGFGGRIRPSLSASLEAGSTDPDHEVVRRSNEAWQRHFGAPPPPVRGWCGSTDAALLRARGVPVARLGPQPRSAPPGLEALDLDELLTFSRIDAELLLELSGSAGALGAPRTTMEAR